jgi:choice-of-anchor C domain-containing protein
MNLLTMTQKLAKVTNSETFNKHSLLKVSIASSVFAVGALIVTPVQATNLIQNGTFESGLVIPSQGFLQITAPSTELTGWKVSSGSIDYISTFWQPSTGDRSLDMNGDRPGAIEQAFSTTPGTKYQVTFDLAGNPTAGPDPKVLRVGAAGSFQDFQFSTAGKSVTNMGWVSKSWEFTAIDTSTLLQFSGANSLAAGPALDNVSVIALSDPPTTSVPEPSSMLGLLSLGVLGIGSALKRQS